jgi:hypothetical protein
MPIVNVETLPRLPFDRRGDLPPVPAVYIVLASDKAPLYVGETGNLLERMRSHHHKPAFQRSDCCVVWREEPRQERRGRLERQLIAKLKPRLNVTPGRQVKGVLKSQKRRLLALMERPCMTLEVVADRLGVTRQRIHQIAGELGIDTGARRRVCTLKQHKLREGHLLPDTHPRIIERLVALRGQGYSVQGKYMPKSGQMQKAAVDINGISCRICITESPARKLRPRSRVSYFTFQLPRSNAEFLILYIAQADVAYVVRRSWVSASICIPIGRIEGYNNIPQRDWEQWREAWHLLAAPRQHPVQEQG